MVNIGGVGYHVDAVPVTTFQTWLQLSKALEFTYTPAVMFAKLAALFLLYQVFGISRYRHVIATIGLIIILQGLISAILAFSICRPFRYFWTQAVDVNDGSCGDVMLFYKSYSIPSLVTDVVMMVLPWPILLQLQMQTSEKIGLLAFYRPGMIDWSPSYAGSRPRISTISTRLASRLARGSLKKLSPASASERGCFRASEASS